MGRGGTCTFTLREAGALEGCGQRRGRALFRCSQVPSGGCSREDGQLGARTGVEDWLELSRCGMLATAAAWW